MFQLLQVVAFSAEEDKAFQVLHAGGEGDDTIVGNVEALQQAK